MQSYSVYTNTIFPPRNGRFVNGPPVYEAKVLMPENASNIPLDDEDILDLTVVAEPGLPGAALGDNSPPEPGDRGDFGADLDALLDSLGANGAINGAPAPQAAPIADQTPVDYKVDPDEVMAMPEMSDIDSLLAELGAGLPMERALAPAPGKPAPEALDSPAPSAPMPEFDGILAQAQAAAALKAKEEAKAAPAENDPLAERGVAAPTAVPAAAAPAGAPVAAPAAAPLAPKPQADGHEEFDPDGDSLDLNELDALLDDILATAPEMSTPAAQAAPVPIPVPDQALMPVGPDYSEELAALAAKVQRLEEVVEVLEATEITESMMEGLIEAKLAERVEAFLEPGSPFMNRVINEVRGQFADGVFDECLEKMAAAAAAKVIREEIASLMQEDG